MAPSERLGSCPTRVCCPSKINCQLLGKTLNVSSKFWWTTTPRTGASMSCGPQGRKRCPERSLPDLTLVLFGLARSSQSDIDKHLRVLRLLAPRHCSVHFASLRAESDRYHGVLEATRQGPLNLDLASCTGALCFSPLRPLLWLSLSLLRHLSLHDPTPKGRAGAKLQAGKVSR